MENSPKITDFFAVQAYFYITEAVSETQILSLKLDKKIMRIFRDWFE